MTDLPTAVADLVRAATTETDPRKLRSRVEGVLDSFDGAPAAAREAAVKAIGRAFTQVEGPGVQVLCLALGALVEAGASPELAWPSISRDLGEQVDLATAFATAAVRTSKQPDLDVALEAVGAAIAKKKPREAAAWKTLPARCLTAVACLTRSKKLRAKQRSNEDLFNSAWPLSDVVSEVGYLLQALRIVDDETLLVLAPALQRGWRFSIDSMPSNAELYILLADLLVGAAKDGKKGRLRGKRPDPRAVASIREGKSPTKAASSVSVPFHLMAWTTVGDDHDHDHDHDHDGHDHDHDHDHDHGLISVEGIPGDIPELGRERVVLLHDAAGAPPIPVAPSFEGLRPTVTLDAELGADEVGRAMARVLKAATKARAPKARANKPEQAKKSAPKKKRS